MTASYYVLVTDELLDSDLDWESAGLHMTERGTLAEPGARWCRFTDDGAPPELNGKRVDLVIGFRDGRHVITRRTVVP